MISEADICAKKSIKDRFEKLELWANRSEENMLKYNKLLLCFDKASSALMNYYKKNYDLEYYADQVENILSYYICDKTLDASILEY